MTREDIRDEVQQRLGDTDAELWTEAELNTYIQAGYDRIALGSGLLWDFALFPDYAAAFNYTSAFEWAHIEAISTWRISGEAQYTASFERDYADNAMGPANHTQHWEYVGGYVDPAPVGANVTLPENLHQIERSTWNDYRIEPLRSRDLEDEDARYELNAGQVDGYIQDKDGLRTLRKWRVPSTSYDGYSYDSDSSEYGLLRVIDGVTTEAPNGVWGELQSVPGEEVANGPWGVIRLIAKAPNVMRVEYRKRGAALDSDDVVLEIPDRYVSYIRWFVMAEALGREGDTQDLELAQYFRQRFAVGMARIQRRRIRMESQRKVVMGGAGPRRTKPALARLPYTYGKVVR